MKEVKDLHAGSLESKIKRQRKFKCQLIANMVKTAGDLAWDTVKAGTPTAPHNFWCSYTCPQSQRGQENGATGWYLLPL